MLYNNYICWIASPTSRCGGAVGKNLKSSVLHRQWWRLHMCEKFSSETKNLKQTNISIKYYRGRRDLWTYCSDSLYDSIALSLTSSIALSILKISRPKIILPTIVWRLTLTLRRVFFFYCFVCLFVFSFFFFSIESILFYLCILISFIKAFLALVLLLNQSQQGMIKNRGEGL